MIKKKSTNQLFMAGQPTTLPKVQYPSEIRLSFDRLPYGKPMLFKPSPDHKPWSFLTTSTVSCRWDCIFSHLRVWMSARWIWSQNHQIIGEPPRCETSSRWVYQSSYKPTLPFRGTIYTPGTIYRHIHPSGKTNHEWRCMIHPSGKMYDISPIENGDFPASLSC